jgi:hypothetical protein
LFDWRSFKKNQICFFVDRDLSDLIPETLQTDKNIYVTTGYSIELDLVNKDVCKRVLSELLGFAHADHDELEAVGELFEAQYELFRLELLPVMSWILNWRRLRLKASLNNIEMKDLFAIKDGRLQALANPDGQSNAAVYIHKKCSLVFDPSIDIEPLKVEMFSANNYRKFARGKFAMWFLIEFCNTTHRDRVSLFPSLARTPRVSVPIGPSNGMALIAPRGRLPLALREFIDQTYVAFSAIQS